MMPELDGAGLDGPVRVLLVEDDDGDALIVEELLAEAGADIVLRRARSFAEAKGLAAGVSCVLLDLGLPDSQGLAGLGWLTEHEPQVAVVVLTGVADVRLGAAAVRAGAQDYLFKGQVEAGLLSRVIRYAMERRLAQEANRELQAARIYAQENARLERGLLPSPLLADPRLTTAARYLAGGQQRLLGGDFYDVIQVGDGWVHALIGDVCGRGPAEAALGVCLRVAWRALILAGRPAGEILATVAQVLDHERDDDTMFATLCMVSIAPDRASAWVRLAGHMPPLLISHGPGGAVGTIRELAAPACPPPGLGRAADWAPDWSGSQVELPALSGGGWSVLMFTDGLIEGRIGPGSERLGSEGLMNLVTSIRTAEPSLPDDQLLERVIDEVRKLNGGDLDDDLAVLALSCRPAAGSAS
ncbi:MAG TPA: fused response regulator/phosphatase [Streptosporangiaceae bacterium]|nr:fused response regulator/phosphatase [Streptosporangiaceae bacterium]